MNDGLISIIIIGVVVIGLSICGINKYNSFLETEAASLEQQIKMNADSLSYYRYEYKHSTSGTIRHVGKALQRVVDKMREFENNEKILSAMLNAHIERRKAIAAVLW